MVKWTRGLANWTKALAICTGILVVAAALQFLAMWGQLGEMKAARESGDRATASQIGVLQTQATAMQKQVDAMQAASAQTERAIDATNRLAEEARRSADESHRLADATGTSADQSRKLVQAAIQANGITRKLADAATRQAEINKEALIGVQRAFIFAKDVSLDKYLNAQITGDITGTKPLLWIARVQWENSGATPTRNLVIDTNCVASFQPIERPWAVTAAVRAPPDKIVILSKEQTRTVLGPHATVSAAGCLLTGVEIMFHALSLPFHRYVFGSARYQDMLGEPVVHRTDFCYELTFGGNPETGWVDDPKVPPLTATAHLCTEHNCADAECKKYDQEDAAKATPK